MTPSQRQKAKIKERIRLSNEAVKNGLPPDEWVLKYRAKNNSIKSKWKAKQIPKPKKTKVANKGCFVKGQIPHNKKTQEEKAKSLEKWRENTRLWHKTNKEKVNKYKREKRQTDIQFKLSCNLRKRLSFLVKLHSAKKSGQTMNLLGCDMDFFINYLQSKFKEGMSFDNYGEWHIDHIKPCDSFDMTNIEHQKECFHYSNLQPLWALENRIKSNKVAA